MSERRATGAIAGMMVLPAVTLVIDAFLLSLLHGAIQQPALLRIMTLGAGLAAGVVVDRLVSRSKPAGFWPLVLVASVLSYGLYVALAYRMQDIQPLALLAAAWFGPIIFVGYGAWRISRWR